MGIGSCCCISEWLKGGQCLGSCVWAARTGMCCCLITLWGYLCGQTLMARPLLTTPVSQSPPVYLHVTYYHKVHLCWITDLRCCFNWIRNHKEMSIPNPLSEAFALHTQGRTYTGPAGNIQFSLCSLFDPKWAGWDYSQWYVHNQNHTPVKLIAIK